MICPHCKSDVNGVTNSRNELRCELCYGILPDAPEPTPKPKQETPQPQPVKKSPARRKSNK